jgi:hypothetical protein
MNKLTRINAGAVSPCPGNTGTARVAEARVVPTSPKMKCRECDGVGEAQYMALDDTEYRWSICHRCDGEGTEEPYCETCGGKLTFDLFCYDCSDYLDGHAPVGWERAERSAYGMTGGAPRNPS